MVKKWLAILNNIDNKDFWVVLLLVVLNILPRLTYIFNGGFFIDGDEAILGTAVQDLVSNHHLQIFLYGQTYGFVPFEVLASSILSFFFGINIFTMKMAMLFFWLASVVMMYYIGKKIFNSRRLAGLAVIFISFTPIWFDWATKARIGYLLAMMISNIIILLTFSRKNIVRPVAISVLLIIIYYAQPLWLIIVAPFIIYYFFKDSNYKYAVIFGASSLMLWLASRLFLSAIGFSYQLQSKLGLSQVARNLKNIFNHYAAAYSGQFFDAANLPLNYLTGLVGIIFIGILLLTIIYNLYLAKVKKLGPVNIIFFSSVLLYMLFMLFYNDAEYAYRYLLPVFIPAIFLIILTIKQIPKEPLRKKIYVGLIFYILLSLVSGIYFYVYPFPAIKDGYSEVERIKSLEEFLSENNIKCVYALDWITSQHINYFMPEISVRHKDIDPRRPGDSSKVDQSAAQSNNCALVGLWYQLPLFTSLYKLDDIIVINKRYIAHLRPQREALEKLKFKLTIPR